MFAGIETKTDLFTIHLHPVGEIDSYDQLVEIVVAETEKQVQAMADDKRLLDGDDQQEFTLGCDALNYARLERRLREEFPDIADDSVLARLAAAVAEAREYDADDFASAIEAVEHRVRLPYGLDPLAYADLKARQRPIRLKVDDLAKAELPTRVAAIALHLQKHVGELPIFLPVEQLRKILKCRKLVVSGALRRLTNAEILKKTGRKPRTGKAQEFSFLGKEGRDFEFVEPQETPDAKQSPHL